MLFSQEVVIQVFMICNYTYTLCRVSVDTECWCVTEVMCFSWSHLACDGSRARKSSTSGTESLITFWNSGWYWHISFTNLFCCYTFFFLLLLHHLHLCLHHYYQHPRSGELQMQILKSCLLRTQSWKVLPFKTWSRSVCSHACYAYCLGFLPC